MKQSVPEMFAPTQLVHTAVTLQMILNVVRKNFNKLGYLGYEATILERCSF
jgi:hypothetical protein